MKTSELRAAAFERDGWCVWPGCPLDADELAHLHSKGMGGRASAQTLDNVAMMCHDHARISDGEYGSGGRSQYEQAHAVLFYAVGWPQPPQTQWGWWRAEALRKRIGVRDADTKSEGRLDVRGSDLLEQGES